MNRLPFLSILLLLSAAALAQTANGSPTDPAAPGRHGTPQPVSRNAPSVGPARATPGAKLPADKYVKLPKPSAKDLAAERKLEHDLKICIGC